MTGGGRPRAPGAAATRERSRPGGPTGEQHPLEGRLAREIRLTDEERAAVRAVPVRVREVAADTPILREGDRPIQCFMVLSGLTCMSKVVGTGARQIVAFHVPGDLPDLHGMHLGRLDSDVWAVAPSTLALMGYGPVLDLSARHPRVAAALWRLTLVDAAIYREWVVNLGQRLAVQRLAHVFCEVLARMEAAGLAQGDARGGTCAFPVTQGDLGEATGLSLVHVNRTLQELRQAGLVSFEGGRLAVLDRAALAERGDFDPAYLHPAGSGATGPP